MNNFKKLEKHNLKNISHQTADVNKNISGSIGLISLVSNVIELYLPKVAELFVSLTGGACKPINTPPNKHSDTAIEEEPIKPIDHNDSFRHI